MIIPLRFGLGFGQDQTVHNISQYAETAERFGFDHISIVDINNLAHEVNVMMTLAAGATNRIHIGHGVTNPKVYHPGAIANAAATLRELHGDRVFIGIGTGADMGNLLHQGVSVAELREAIVFMQQYSSGEEGSWRGTPWHNEWIARSVDAGRAVPIWMAVAGPRNCRVAGELASAVLSVGMDPELQRWRREQVDVGAEKAARDASEIDFWIRTQIYITESKQAARRELAPYAATCTLELYTILRQQHPAIEDLRRRLERRHPGILDELRIIHDNYDPYWTERADGPQTEYVSQRVIDLFIASGTIDEIGDRIEALAPLGIAGVSSVLFSIEEDLEMLQRISGELMPRFSSGGVKS